MVSPQSTLEQLPLFAFDKRCRTCGEVKPFEEFHRDRYTADGYTRSCKPCRARVQRTSYVKHAEKRRAEARAYHMAHREQELVRMRAWREQNAEKRVAYIVAHRAELAANARAYYQRHRLRIRGDAALRTKGKHYREAHRDEISARRKVRYQLNPEPARRRARRREALKAAAEGSHSVAQWEALKVLYGQRCLRCGRADRPLSEDHVVPLSRGGTDSIDNIQPLCRPCNTAKHAKTIDYRPSQP